VKRFESKVVLITGGTSGNGLALARAFLREGALVALCGRDRASAEAFQEQHQGALGFSCDITDPAAQIFLAGRVAMRFGRLDILVNGVGRLAERDFSARPPAPEELAAEFQLNLVGPVQLTAHALSRWPCLEAIVFMSSGHALVSPRRAPTYAAAAAGIHGFAESLRRQLEPRGIHVLEVMPPGAATRSGHRRGVQVSAEAIAEATLDALAVRRPLAQLGLVRLLPWLLRLAPRATRRRFAEA
jgi:uncharacterized oxidoreductase